MDGWEPALTDLVRYRGGPLVRYARLLCGDQREAEDLVQEALIRVFAATRRPRGERRGDATTLENAEAYVRRTVLNLFLDGYRRRQRWVAVRHLLGGPGATAGPERVVADRLDLAAALATLPPRQRACVVLRYYEDRSVPEIAADLGVTAGTVKRHLHDANASLAAHLAPAVRGGSA